MQFKFNLKIYAANFLTSTISSLIQVHIYSLIRRYKLKKFYTQLLHYFHEASCPVRFIDSKSIIQLAL